MEHDIIHALEDSILEATTGAKVGSSSSGGAGRGAGEIEEDLGGFGTADKAEHALKNGTGEAGNSSVSRVPGFSTVEPFHVDAGTLRYVTSRAPHFVSLTLVIRV